MDYGSDMRNETKVIWRKKKWEGKVCILGTLPRHGPRMPTFFWGSSIKTNKWNWECTEESFLLCCEDSPFGGEQTRSFLESPRQYPLHERTKRHHRYCIVPFVMHTAIPVIMLSFIHLESFISTCLVHHRSLQSITRRQENKKNRNVVVAAAGRESHPHIYEKIYHITTTTRCQIFFCRSIVRRYSFIIW